TAIRLALRAEGVDVEVPTAAFNLPGGQPALELKTKKNGAEMIRLAAALLILQEENTGFSEKDRIAALCTVTRLKLEGTELGYRKDAEELLKNHEKRILDDERTLIALARMTGEGDKDEDQATARELLHKSLPLGQTKVITRGDSQYHLTKAGSRITIEELKDGRVIRGSLVSIDPKDLGKEKAIYTQNFINQMKFEGPNSRRLDLAKRLLFDVGSLTPSADQKREAALVLAELAQAFDTVAELPVRLASAKALATLLYPGEDYARRVGTTYLSKADLDALEEKLIVSLTDLSVDGSDESRKLLLSLAAHNREKVLALILHAIPYTKRLPFDRDSERAKQIKFHLTAYQYDPGDYTFGGKYIERGWVSKNTSNELVMPQPPDPTPVERAMKELQNANGRVTAKQAVFSEFAIATLTLEKGLKPGARVPSLKLGEALTQPYKQVDKAKVEAWAELMLDAAEQTNAQLSPNELAILTGGYLEAMSAVGTKKPYLQRTPFDTMLERLSKNDGNELKLLFAERYVPGLSIRVSLQDSLRQAANRAANSDDPSVRDCYNRVQTAIKTPLEMKRFDSFFQRHGKTFMPEHSSDVEKAYFQMADKLIEDVRISRAKLNREEMVPATLAQSIVRALSQFAALKEFIDTAPDDIRLMMAENLLAIGGLDELGFRAAGQAIQSKDERVRRKADEILKRFVPDRGPALDSRRKLALHNAFARLSAESENPNDLLKVWTKKAEKSGDQAEMQEYLKALKNHPDLLKTLLDEKMDENQRKLGIVLFLETFEQEPKQVEKLVSMILEIKVKSIQSACMSTVKEKASGNRALVTVVLEVLQAKNVLPDLQRELKQSIEAVPANPR
ncbi:MAG: hypothetical protein K2Z81_20480, partial [Cyanobacteria bacterium]|nr:hypothetical protein [Cyanobacteriota bacterium]